MRSVELYSFYIAYASVKERKGDRLFLRDPANARDVPAGPLVAPPRIDGTLLPQETTSMKPLKIINFKGPIMTQCVSKFAIKTRLAEDRERIESTQAS